jgi:hypothetical protein
MWQICKINLNHANILAINVRSFNINYILKLLICNINCFFPIILQVFSGLELSLRRNI